KKQRTRGPPSRGLYLGRKSFDVRSMPGSRTKTGCLVGTRRNSGRSKLGMMGWPGSCARRLSRRNARLRPENQELHETNELLKPHPLFTSELYPKHQK